MKTRLLLACAGLAILFAVPAPAQEQNTVNPEVRQQIEAALIKFSEAFNKHDAATIAALLLWHSESDWTMQPLRLTHYVFGRLFR
jgi:hypothetical protein